MVKNKKYPIPLIAGIIILIVIGVYYLISKKSSVGSVSVEGRIVCLPSKDLYVSQFTNCPEYGLLTDNGKYYEFANTDSIEGGIGSFSPSLPVVVSGKITSQKKYDTDGTLIITTISPKSKGADSEKYETETIEIEPENQ